MCLALKAEGPVKSNNQTKVQWCDMQKLDESGTAIYNYWLVLEIGYCPFSDHHKLQTKGTAMRTKDSPTIAKLALWYFQHKLKIWIFWGKEPAKTI